MNVEVFKTKELLGQKAGTAGAKKIAEAIKNRGVANIILATGTSQFATMQTLVAAPDIDWSKVHVFHLDEYVGIVPEHPASFRKYIAERFVSKVNNLKSITYIHGDADDPYQECTRLDAIIQSYPIDVAFIGIGENGHVAFNDPPANFETEKPFLVVTLDEACRRQQMGEGWFKSLAEVPDKAISMSVRQIMKSHHIVCSVPDQRKAEAVKNAITSEVSNLCPASILQTHPHCTMYVDEDAASLLKNNM